jgi:hypothetical protein
MSSNYIRPKQPIRDIILENYRYRPNINNIINAVETFFADYGINNINDVKGDGFCLIYSILKSLEKDHYHKPEYLLANIALRISSKDVFIKEIEKNEDGDEVEVEKLFSYDEAVSRNFDYHYMGLGIVALARTFWKEFNRADIIYYEDNSTLSREWIKPIMKALNIKKLIFYQAVFDRHDDKHINQCDVNLGMVSADEDIIEKVIIYTDDGKHYKATAA